MFVYLKLYNFKIKYLTYQSLSAIFLSYHSTVHALSEVALTSMVGRRGKGTDCLAVNGMGLWN
jgi:hypothetical protein